MDTQRKSVPGVRSVEALEWNEENTSEDGQRREIKAWSFPASMEGAPRVEAALFPLDEALERSASGLTPLVSQAVIV